MEPAYRIQWSSSIWLVILHLGAIAAPFFTPPNLIVILVIVAMVALLHFVTGCIGITLTYHRLLTHQSFKTSRTLRFFLAWIGGLAGEGPAIDWVMDHRMHHAYTDKEGDPHSPKDGGWWSHIWWIFFHGLTRQEKARRRKKYVPDLIIDWEMRLLDWLFIPSHIALGAFLFYMGWHFHSFETGVALVLWGMFFRIVAVLHCTWMVNSASHMWGYCNYDTGDESRNNWFVALITYGEGWHNNHHAFPRMAPQGHKWWEIDITYRCICLLESLHLVSDVVRHSKAQRAAA